MNGDLGQNRRGQSMTQRPAHCPTGHPRRTLKAYRQDFDAIAALVADDDPQDLVRLPLAVIDTEAMRSAFAEFARSHEAASIRRCWSTWNVLCTFLLDPERVRYPIVRPVAWLSDVLCSPFGLRGIALCSNDVTRLHSSP